MPTNHFPIVGIPFKTSWDSKGMAFPFGSGSSNRGESTLLAGESKGDSVPLAGGIQWRAGPPWQEESNETGGFVAHDFAGKV